jgi:hypothetical protein
VDQARFSLEAGQTDWGNMSGWRMGVEWITMPQRLAHVNPEHKNGGCESFLEKSLGNP